MAVIVRPLHKLYSRVLMCTRNRDTPALPNSAYILVYHNTMYVCSNSYAGKYFIYETHNFAAVVHLQLANTHL